MAQFMNQQQRKASGDALNLTERENMAKSLDLGWTPIHKAAAYGELNVVESLVKSGVSCDSLNEMMETPIHFAAARGHIDVVKFLIKCGCDVNSADIYDRTALHAAAHFGYQDILILLISAQANVNYQDCRGWSALCYAVAYGHILVINLLLKAGAKTNVILENGLGIESLTNDKRILEIIGNQAKK